VAATRGPGGPGVRSIAFRPTPAQLHEIDLVAASVGLTRSEVIRRYLAAGLSGGPPPAPDEETLLLLAEAGRQVRAAGVLLNQIATRLHLLAAGVDSAIGISEADGRRAAAAAAAAAADVRRAAAVIRRPSPFAGSLLAALDGFAASASAAATLEDRGEWSTAAAVLAARIAEVREGLAAKLAEPEETPER
jgi:hypothetical protein